MWCKHYNRINCIELKQRRKSRSETRWRISGRPKGTHKSFKGTVSNRYPVYFFIYKSGCVAAVNNAETAMKKRPVSPAGNRQPIRRDPLPAVSYKWFLTPKPTRNHTLTHYTWFPALRCCSRICVRSRFRCRFRNRFRKNRVRTCRSVCSCWGVCAAVARQAQEAGRRVGGAPGVLLRTERQIRKIELDPIWTDQFRAYSNGAVQLILCSPKSRMCSPICKIVQSKICALNFHTNNKSYSLICSGGRWELATCSSYKCEGCTVSVNSVAGLQRLTHFPGIQAQRKPVLPLW